MGRHRPDEDFIAYITDRMLWLRRIAFLLCQDWHQADDLAQTAITKLYANWPKARRADSLDAYLRTILLNTYLTERRMPWRRRTVVRQELIDTPVVEFPPDVRIDLQRALAAIPPGQRAAIVLRYFCDLTVEQTAHELNCSTGNVKSQTSRGLDALRRVMGDHSTVQPLSGTESYLS